MYFIYGFLRHLYFILWNGIIYHDNSGVFLFIFFVVDVVVSLLFFFLESLFVILDFCSLLDVQSIL